MTMTIAKTIACGNHRVHGRTWGVQHHHASVDQVRECFATEGGIASLEDEEQAAQVEYDADAAYERHLENAGWAEARAQEDHEAALGVLSEEACEEAARVNAEQAQYAVDYYRLLRDPFPAAGTIVLPDEDGMPGLVIGPKVEQPTLDVKVKVDFQGLPDGTYTVDLPMYGTHRTYRVRTQKDDAKFAPGKRILSVLVGPDNGSDYAGIGFVSTDARGLHHLHPWNKYHASGVATQEGAQTLLSDPRAALVAGECFRCHRLLTTPESLSAGIGPECRKKVGL